eukprot:250674-Rhodomonas_salina.6
MAWPSKGVISKISTHQHDNCSRRRTGLWAASSRQAELRKRGGSAPAFPDLCGEKCKQGISNAEKNSLEHRAETGHSGSGQ